MSIILETYKVQSNFLNFDHPKTYLTLGLFISVLGFIINWSNGYINILFIETFSYALIFAGLLIILVSTIFNWFSYQDYSLSKKGIIKITSDNIIIDNTQIILYEEITDFSIHLTDFKGDIDYLYGETKAYLKLGVENEILIKYSNKTLKRNFQLHEGRELELVRNFISRIIIKNKIPNVPVIKLAQVFSKDFRKLDDTRNYLAEKIIIGEINTIEGLLLMEYKSDKEAKELKEKYSL